MGADDGDEIEDPYEASLPSHAPSGASGFPGDLNVSEDQLEGFIIKPDWSTAGAHHQEWLQGTWEETTRDGGDAADLEVPVFRGGGGKGAQP